jgi:hypothetical protein
MKYVSLFLIDVRNQLLALGELAESPPCFWSIFAGFRYKLDETIISPDTRIRTYLSLASFACPSKLLNLGSRGLIRENGKVSSLP